MQFGYAWAVIKRSIVLVAVVTLVGALGGLAWNSITRQYTTSAHLALFASESSAGTRAVNPERYVQTTIQTMLSDEVLSTSITALNEPDLTVAGMRESIAISGGIQSDVVELTVTGPSEQASQERINALTQTITTHAQETYSTRLLWTGPTEPTSSRTVTMVVGAVAGAVVCAIVLLVLAAGRRPLLDPYYLEVASDRTDVFPEALVIGSKRFDQQMHNLRDWLNGQPPTDIVQLPSSRWGAMLTERLTSTAEHQTQQPAAATRTAVVLAVIGHTTESAVDRTARRLTFTHDQVIVVALSGQGKWT